jgi:hypothetical protein
VSFAHQRHPRGESHDAPATRDDFIAFSDTLAENDQRALHALAPDQTPLGPLTRLADIRPFAVTLERGGKPMVVAGAVSGAPGATATFFFSAADATATDLIEAADYFFKQVFVADAQPQPVN